MIRSIINYKKIALFTGYFLFTMELKAQDAWVDQVGDFVEWVNPLMGTDSKPSFSNGNVYPAIARPWGMNFWTPQTGEMGNGWIYASDGRVVQAKVASSFISWEQAELNLKEIGHKTFEVVREEGAEVWNELLGRVIVSGWLPEWASPGLRNVMIGNNSASVVADAYLKIGEQYDYDIETLFEALVHGANNAGPLTAVGRAGVDHYNTLGSPLFKKTTGKTNIWRS